MENDMRIMTPEEAVKEYQCPGCVGGPFESCYVTKDGITCSKHTAGTVKAGVGAFFLGLPRGFCRVGALTYNPITIFAKFEDGWGYTMFNVPAWKYLNGKKHTLVRGLSPRTNNPFIHIFLEDCMDKINCLEITQDNIILMD